MILHMLMEMQENHRYDWLILAKNGAFAAENKTETEIALICHHKKLKNPKGVARTPSTEKLWDN